MGAIEEGLDRIDRLEARITALERLNNGKPPFTNQLQWVYAYRRFMTDPGYNGWNDKMVKPILDGTMDDARKADNPDSSDPGSGMF